MEGWLAGVLQQPLLAVGASSDRDEKVREAPLLQGPARSQRGKSPVTARSADWGGGRHPCSPGTIRSEVTVRIWSRLGPGQPPDAPSRYDQLHGARGWSYHGEGCRFCQMGEQNQCHRDELSDAFVRDVPDYLLVDDHFLASVPRYLVFLLCGVSREIGMVYRALVSCFVQSPSTWPVIAGLNIAGATRSWRRQRRLHPPTPLSWTCGFPMPAEDMHC